VNNSPLFVLRHHCAPISDLLVEPHSDAVLISAAMDGGVAAWDFRNLTTMTKSSDDSLLSMNRSSRVVRDPSGVLYSKHSQQSSRNNQCSFGPVHLTKGISSRRRTVQCLGGDATLREWDYRNGEIVRERTTGHCDTVSSFVALARDKVLGTQLESAGPDIADVTLSASWDGTIRMRSFFSE
jgi:WD40 repeat protein